MNEYEFEILNEELRQHISLSNKTMSIIELDIIRFTKTKLVNNRSGFINTIIKNYYNSFPLSTNMALRQFREFVKEFNINNKESIKYSKKIMNELIEDYAKTYRYEHNFKLKLDIDTRDILESLEDAFYYKDAPRSPIAFYLKSILESYANLNHIERQEIYFKEYLNTLNECITNNTFIKYKNNNKYIKVAAFIIKENPIDFNLELVTGQIDSDSNVKLDTIKIKDLVSLAVKGLKEKHRINKQIIELVNTQYTKNSSSNTNIEEFTIKFTANGLTRFLQEEDTLEILGFPENNDPNIYKFKTTEPMIYLTFFKYGFDAEILSHNNLRERFKKIYYKSYELYKD